MSVEIPHEVRYVIPFLTRAKELETIQPAASYWTKYWAVQKILSRKLRSPEIDALLLRLLEELEAFKRVNAGLIEIANQEKAAIALTSFALQVFDNADREERARKATTSTVEKFMAAAVFLEACESFGQPSKDILDKRKYSKVQAMRIGSAIAAGKNPNAGRTPSQEPVFPSVTEESSPDQHDDQIETQIVKPLVFAPVNDEVSVSLTENDQSQPFCPLTDDTEIGRTINRPIDKEVISGATSPDTPFPLVVKNDSTDIYVHASPSLATDEAKDRDQDEGQPIMKTSSVCIDTEQAQKHAKWAISALNYEDIDTAVAELKKALNALAA